MGVGQSVESLYFQQKVKLGQGGFGTVWRAVDRTTHRFVAVKQIDKLKAYWQGAKRSDLLLEIDFLKACDHVNITKLYNYFEDSSSISIAMEYCDGGDLEDKLKERGAKLPEAQSASWTRQICGAIKHLHERDICHRDIKPGNFMFSTSLLKLSDFGFATFLKKGQTTMEEQLALATWCCLATWRSSCLLAFGLLTALDVGTPAFMAPEQHQLSKGGPGYSHSVDVWAAGCMLHMFLSNGRHPFVTSKNSLDMANLLKGNADFGLSMFGELLGVAVAPEAKDLCRRMLAPEPRSRIGVEEVLQNIWVKSEKEEVPEDAAQHFAQLKQQLLMAEQQLKEAEERELSLKSRLQKQDDSVVLVTIPVTLPACINRCSSCTTCAADRIEPQRIKKW
ncbi:unnamed protein product [Effrenium voratum]|uniref:Protein kinase domain-containing protein n=1 Tax=Effrenium voratum TaxID=2562239 RepID=A0AA36JCS7_9DINO|nr:unnamed protein product [Effrenium voratum]